MLVIQYNCCKIYTVTIAILEIALEKGGRGSISPGTLYMEERDITPRLHFLLARGRGKGINKGWLGY